jgi:hypothetical protein
LICGTKKYLATVDLKVEKLEEIVMGCAQINYFQRVRQSGVNLINKLQGATPFVLTYIEHNVLEKIFLGIYSFSKTHRDNAN